MAESVPGMLTRDELTRLVETGEIETVLTVFPDFYGRLMGKRMTGPFFVKSVGDHGMHTCDYLLTCDMEMDPVQGYRFTSWEKGYGDMHAVVDWPTLRRAAWLEKTALVLCDLVGEPGDAPIEVAPRRILQRQVERAAEMGFFPKAGSEIEVYLFRDSYESARAKGYRNLEPLGSYIEDYYIFPGTKEEPLVGAIVRGLSKSGIPVENSKGEWGPGQQEINLEFCDVVEQADRNVLYKHAAREIADQQGLAVTFMAKWDAGFAGNSMHQHLSLWDAAGKRSLFAGKERLGPVECSDAFRWFLGGWMAHAGELSAFFAPSVNSYKRYQASSFAPTAIAWAIDNRTVGFRVVGRGDSLRIECRMPGADANPYLAYAAALAAGLAGVRDRIEPPAHYEGNAYAATDLPRLPASLRDAVDRLEKSALAREAFGEEVVEHYLQFLRTEQRKFDGVVTDWERARFFERG
ncbi:MAG TPA: glutamine synthetase family protein [Thermoanaerobaculia bacterium]|nr:glutamine synthetase family protein [Thermoanaerobaculia bacterium]